MTRFAADVLRILPLRFQPCMRRCSEVARDRFVAGRALLRADKLRTGDAGRSKNCAVSRAAGKQNDGKRNSSPRAPKQSFAPAEDPSS